VVRPAKFGGFQMTDAVMRARTDEPRRFYMWMSASCLAIAVLGFMPTYFVPMARGTLVDEPIVHIHGIILFAWVTFFFTQSWLVAQGKVLSHRNWGLLGISIFTAMVFIVTAVVSLRIAQAQLPGQPAGAAHAVRAFSWVSIGGLVFIVPVFILAMVKLRDTETHKRLMLLLTISLLGAPIARWFLTFLAPAPDASAPPPPAGLPVVNIIPIFVTIAPALVGDILWLIAMVYDYRTRGRVHPVYTIGGAIMVLIQVTAVPVSESAIWQNVAYAIGHLAG
jgi:hypothetical protein